MAEGKAVVVPAYPYEGALFLLLDTQAERRSARQDGYYGALYGPEAHRRIGIASSLAALFDEVTIAGADVAFPEGGQVGRDEALTYPDLGVSLQQSFGEWREESKYLVSRLQESEAIQGLWHRRGFFSDRWSQEFFLTRMTSQILLARECGAILLGNSLFRKFYEVAAPIISAELGEDRTTSVAWGIGYRDIELLTLRYAVSSIDDFAAVRASGDIRAYSKEVRRALSEAIEAEDTRSRLAELANQALDNEAVARKVQRWAGDINSNATVAGIIPGVGTVSGIISLIADGASRVSAAAGRANDWIHISSRMKDVVTDSRIRRALRER